MAPNPALQPTALNAGAVKVPSAGLRPLRWRLSFSVRFYPGVHVIIDHIGIGTADYERSKAFYAEALAPLGIEMIMEFEPWVGFGKAGKAEFWLRRQSEEQNPIHIAFSAETRYQIDAFYEAALAAGAKDNGAPGVRERYHPNYVIEHYVRTPGARWRIRATSRIPDNAV